jgi:hypothetical protein
MEMILSTDEQRQQHHNLIRPQKNSGRITMSWHRK